MLRALRGRRLDHGDLVTAELVGLAISELEERIAVIRSQQQQISRQKQRITSLMMGEVDIAGPLLPGELLRPAHPLPMRDNPQPDSRSPLEVVVSEKTAIRALVRHYNWVHDGPDTLLRCRVLTPAELSPLDVDAAHLVEELAEALGTIADPAAAAALDVVAESAAVPSRCVGVE
jgi:hypothetical protein